jgi:hypothetical protein
LLPFFGSANLVVIVASSPEAMKKPAAGCRRSVLIHSLAFIPSQSFQRGWPCICVQILAVENENQPNSKHIRSVKNLHIDSAA